GRQCRERTAPVEVTGSSLATCADLVSTAQLGEQGGPSCLALARLGPFGTLLSARGADHRQSESANSSDQDQDVQTSHNYLLDSMRSVVTRPAASAALCQRLFPARRSRSPLLCALDWQN